jgi:uncharacterized membrane protein
MQHSLSSRKTTGFLPLQPEQMQLPDSNQYSMNTVIGWILQGGVLVSSAVICFGLILLAFNPGHLDQHLINFPYTLDAVWSGMLGMHPQAFIACGLLLLIATPVMRVATSVFAFAHEHDHRYVLITLVVLSILFMSFILGKAGA